MGATCKIDWCKNPSRTRGWCGHHYARWLKHGNPYKVLRARNGRHKKWLDAVLRVDREACIEWPFKAMLTGGYGQFLDKSAGKGAHRYACFYKHGAAPEGTEAAHSCGNRLCCNWKHLRWATRASNHADKVRHGTAQRGNKHSSSVLTESEVLEIFKDKRKLTEIAADYGISFQHVSAIRNRKKREWLTNEVA